MTNLFDLTGSRAIVTGGTRGLGHGMAEGLMEAGASVVIFGSSDKVEQVAADFRAKGYSCQGVKADLASAEERKAGFEKGRRAARRTRHYHQCRRHPAPLSQPRFSS